MKIFFVTLLLILGVQPVFSETFLDLGEALKIAYGAIKKEEQFKGKFPISARITGPAYKKEQYDGQIYVSIWRIDFSSYYPPPPSSPTFVEVTHDRKVFIRK